MMIEIGQAVRLTALGLGRNYDQGHRGLYGN